MCIAAAIGGAALVGVAGSALTASSSADAAKSAAQTQANAANNASAQQLAMFEQMRQSLQPFVNTGVSANSQLASLTGTNPGGNPLTAPLTKAFQPTMAQLAATPGYQFSLQQGLEATQNSYAAQGLGASGAAQKGAANYAEGLAGTTYQQQFGNYLAQNQQIYNMLGGLNSQGENAAAGVGNAGLGAATTAGGFSTSGAAATAGGTIGAANAFTAGVGGASNAASTSALLAGSGLFGSPTSTVSTTDPAAALGGVGGQFVGAAG